MSSFILKLYTNKGSCWTEDGTYLKGFKFLKQISNNENAPDIVGDHLYINDESIYDTQNNIKKMFNIFDIKIEFKECSSIEELPNLKIEEDKF